MLEFSVLGFLNCFHGIVYLLIGVLVGLIFGIIPGLAGSSALAILIPFTYTLSPENGVLVLAGALGSTTLGGSLTAILINVPGTPSNLATCFDGYPMAKKGLAGEAISTGAWSSFFGSLGGIFTLILLLPYLKQLLLLFGPTEWFYLAIFGIVSIIVVSGESLYKGIVAGILGMLLSFHGLNPVTGGERFTYGIRYLYDGVPLVPLMIGIFAITEMIKMASYGGTIAEGGMVVKGGFVKGFFNVVKRWWLVLRSFVIGIIVGIIPGIGGAVSSFIAYIHAKQTSKNPEEFGHGSVEGLIASEVANNSKDGGALIPTLTLGIPGSPSSAVLLVGILIHGIVPGRQLMTEGLDIVFTILIGYLIAVLLSSVGALLIASKLAKITGVQGNIIAVIVVALCGAGVYAMNSNFNDVIAMFVFGVLGYVMYVLDYSKVSFIIGFILGPVAEQSYHLSLQISGYSHSIFFSRPISLVLLALIIGMLAMPAIKASIVKARKVFSKQTG